MIIPEIKELEDGSVGYFYSPHQLEELALRRWTHNKDRAPAATKPSIFDTPHSLGTGISKPHHGLS